LTASPASPIAQSARVAGAGVGVPCAPVIETLSTKSIVESGVLFMMVRSGVVLSKRVENTS